MRPDKLGDVPTAEWGLQLMRKNSYVERLGSCKSHSPIEFEEGIDQKNESDNGGETAGRSLHLSLDKIASF